MQKLVIKTSAHFAAKFQLLALVKPQQQRAKVFPGTLRIGVAADDEFLLPVKFKFYPLAAAPARFIN